MPPFSPKSAADLVKNARSSALSPLKRTVPRTSARMKTAKSALSSASTETSFSTSATAAEVVRARRDVVRIDDLGGAHPVDILRAFWNLFTTSWADTFVISEITSRIAPR